MFDALLNFLNTTTGGIVLAGSTLAVSVATLGGARWVPATRKAEIAAMPAPLWLLAPLMAAFALAAWSDGYGIVVPVFSVAIPLLFIVQVGLGAWMLYRHRRWPFLVVPLAILCCIWQWGIALGVVAEGFGRLGWR